MTRFLFNLLLIISFVLTSANATGLLGLCAKSTTILTCSDNTALEQLFQRNGPIVSLNCNFTLSGTLDGVTLPYAVTSFTPSNQLDPIPNTAFSPTTENQTIKFSIKNTIIETTLAPYPDLGLEGQKYHEILITYKDTDQYGSSVALLNPSVGTSGLLVEVLGRMKWECIDGTVTLVLMPPDGKNFISETEAFQRKYPGQLLIDDIDGGRASNSGGVFKKVDLVVHILYED